MSLLLQKMESSCRWGIWKMDETLDELLALFPQQEAYRQGMQCFTAVHRQLEWLSVRALLCVMLGEEKEIAYYPSGKPYLVEGSASISISHTKGYVAVLIGPFDREVGIDIEQYGERVRKVANKFMREDEMPTSYQNTEVWSLLLHWSAKETMFKCMNAAEVDFRKHLRILPFVTDKQGVFSAEEYRTTERRNFSIHYYLYPDFVVTMSLL